MKENLMKLFCPIVLAGGAAPFAKLAYKRPLDEDDLGRHVQFDT